MLARNNRAWSVYRRHSWSRRCARVRVCVWEGDTSGWKNQLVVVKASLQPASLCLSLLLLPLLSPQSPASFIAVSRPLRAEVPAVNFP